MKKIKVYINDSIYDVRVALTEKEQEEGLQNTASLPKGEGMLFIADDDDGMSMWMKDTHIPLDIIFINDKWEVIRVTEGEPLSERLISEEEAEFVLELNKNSGVQVGDYVELDELDDILEDYEEEEDERKLVVMVVLGSDGESQMDLVGGERIFSRKNTKTLLRMAKRANNRKTDSSYKALGKKAFSYLKEQDERDPDYVEIKD